MKGLVALSRKQKSILQMMNQKIVDMSIVPLCLKVGGVLKKDDQAQIGLGYSFKQELSIYDRSTPAVDIAATSSSLLGTIKTSAKVDPTEDEPTESR